MKLLLPIEKKTYIIIKATRPIIIHEIRVQISDSSMTNMKYAPEGPVLQW